MTDTAQSVEQFTASEAEQFVCAYWELVAVYWNPSIPDRFRIEMVDTRNMVEEEITHCGLPKTDAEMTEQRAWLAAYQFTLEHQEQVRQAEIDVCGVDATRDKLLVQLGTRILENNPHGAFIGTRALCSCARILARLEAIMAELRRGVKE